MLRVDDLVASYGQVRALHGVCLEAGKGEIIGILGSIGAGKSTLLKCICGLKSREKGGIYYRERDISGLPSHAIALQGVALVAERRRLFTSFTVDDNLRIGAYSVLSKGRKEEYERRLQRVFGIFPLLEKRRKQLATTLSGGEQQMLAIGRAMVAGPDLLLLDEPTLGLAPLIIGEIGKALKMINSEGVTIVVAEQNASFALSVIQRAYVMEVGNVVFSGTPEQLCAGKALDKAYFGSERSEQSSRP